MRVRGIAYVCIDGKIFPVEVEQEVRGELVDVLRAATIRGLSIADGEDES